MANMLLNELAIKSKHDFMEVLTEKLNSDGKEYYRKISRMVYEAAGLGDSVALGILDGIGEEYARSIKVVIRELDFSLEDKIEIILAGSQFVKCENQRTIEKLICELNENPAGYDIKVLKYPCVTGALVWAAEGIPGAAFDPAGLMIEV